MLYLCRFATAAAIPALLVQFAASPAAAVPGGDVLPNTVHPARLLALDGTALSPGTRFVPANPAGPPAPRLGSRDLAFQIIAQIPPTAAAGVAFGDSDHDLKNEIALYVNDTYTYHYRVEENQGANVYTDEYTGDELIPYAMGDFDGDGLSDLVGQRADRIVVYESLDANSYPSRLAWTSPPLMNVECFLTTADTDHDGRKEFLYSYNPFSGMAKFYIFENTGPDAYTQVYVTSLANNDNTGEKVVADFDNDGRTEIAMCGLLGIVYVIECTGDNAWSRVWTGSTGLFNAYGGEGGVDSNGNGKPEAFFSGSSDPHWCWETQVFEASSNNVFAMAASLLTNDGYLGLGLNTFGDLDGVWPPEFVSEGNSHFWIWRPNASGGWELAQTVEDPLGAGHVQLACRDLNGNGRAEVFWLAEDEVHSTMRSLVLEADFPESVNGPETRQTGLGVAPNPSRGGSPLTLLLPPPASTAADVRLFDAAGRVRASATLAPGQQTWDPPQLEPGVYWLRARNAAGALLGTTRLVLK